MEHQRDWGDEIDDEDDEQRLYWESTNDEPDQYDPEPEDMTVDDWRYWLEVVGR